MKKFDQISVIGSGMGGLCCAAAIAPYCNRVIVFEKDSKPAQKGLRKSVPQGAHISILLQAGLNNLDKILPGISEKLLANGSAKIQAGVGQQIMEFGEWLPERPLNLFLYGQSRPFLEQNVREEVEQIENIDIHYDSRISQLNITQNAVTGILLADGQMVHSDLVIDASGVSGKFINQICKETGYNVKTDEQNIDIFYATAYLKKPKAYRESKENILIVPEPGVSDIGGSLLDVENDTWCVSLHGRKGAVPPKNKAEWLAQAKALSDRRIWDRVKDAHFEGDIATFKKPKATWRRFDIGDPLPQGYVPIGDTISSINPIFGQGMTVALGHSLALADELQQDNFDITRYCKQAAEWSNKAWTRTNTYNNMVDKTKNLAPEKATFIKNLAKNKISKQTESDEAHLKMVYNTQMLDEDTLPQKWIKKLNPILRPQNDFSWLLQLQFLAIVIFVYTSLQRSIYNAGLTGFNASFHYIDSILNAVNIPLIFFVAGAAYKRYAMLNNRLTQTGKVLDYLVYPFVIWNIIQGLIDVVFSGYTGSSSLLVDIYFNLISEPNNHLGLVLGLAITIFVFSLLKNVIIKYPLQAILVSLGVCQIQNFTPVEYPWFYVVHYFPFFIAGIVLATFNPQEHKWLNQRVVVLFSLSVLLIYLIYHLVFHHDTYVFNLSNFILSIIGVASLYLVFRYFFSLSHPLINNIALSAPIIFLVHEIIGHGTREILLRSFGISNAIVALIIVAGSIAVFCGIAILLNKRGLFRFLFTPPRFLSLSRRAEHNAGRRYTRKFAWTIAGIFAGVVGTSFAIDYCVNLRLHVDYESVAHSEITIPTDQASIQEGERLATVYGCYKGCHGMKMEGIEFDRRPFQKECYSANLTQTIEEYDVAELVTIIREGVYPDGSLVMRDMPSASFHHIPDDQLGKIIAFIQNYPKQTNKTRISHYGIMLKAEILDGSYENIRDMVELSTSHFEPQMETLLSQGQQLAASICTECHGTTLSGDLNLGSPHLAITRGYDIDEFKVLIQTGTKKNGESARLMGDVAKMRYSKLNDTEINALYEYLSTTNLN